MAAAGSLQWQRSHGGARGLGLGAAFFSGSGR